MVGNYSIYKIHKQFIQKFPSKKATKKIFSSVNNPVRNIVPLACILEPYYGIKKTVVSTYQGKTLEEMKEIFKKNHPKNHDFDEIFYDMSEFKSLLCKKVELAEKQFELVEMILKNNPEMNNYNLSDFVSRIHNNTQDEEINLIFELLNTVFKYNPKFNNHAICCYLNKNNGKAQIKLVETILRHNPEFNKLPEIIKTLSNCNKIANAQINKSNEILEKNPNIDPTELLEQLQQIDIKLQDDIFNSVNDSDIKATLNMLYNKIQKQLGSSTKKDIEQIVQKLIKDCNVKEQDAIYALSVLTQFGNTRALSSALSQDLDISVFVDTKLVSANSALNYFCNNKNQIPLNGDKVGFVLDNQGLEYLESLSEAELKNFKKDNILFINLEGWDIGTTIYNQNTDNNTMIKRVSKLISEAKTKSNKENISFKDSFKQLLNKQTIERAEKLGINNIKTISNIKEEDKIEINRIIDNLTPGKISFESIGHKADIVSKTLFPNNPKEQAKANELILKYLNSQADIYSPQRLGQRMIKIHNQIEDAIKKWKKADGSGYTLDDVYYLVPEPGKSYEQILLQYTNLNNIKNEHIIYDTANSCMLPDEKVYVILDDVIGSGGTILIQAGGPKYDKINKHTNKHFIIAPIVSSSEGAERIIEEGIKPKNRVGQDIILADESNTLKTIKKSEFYKDLIKKEQKMLLQILNEFKDDSDLSLGYNGNALSIVFPYMAPDNNSALSSLFFEDFLLNSSSMKNLYRRDNEVIKNILKSLEKIKENDII